MSSLCCTVCDGLSLSLAPPTGGGGGGEKEKEEKVVVGRQAVLGNETFCPCCVMQMALMTDDGSRDLFASVVSSTVAI